MPDITYTPTYPGGWQNLPAVTTAIDAAALDHIDDSFAAVYAQANLALSTAQAAQGGIGGKQDADGTFVLPAPTGTAADDPIIAAALSSGRRVIGQPGVYGFTSHLICPDGVDLFGQGGGSTSRAGRTTFKALGPGAQLEIAGGGGLSGGFEIDGNSTATTPFFRNGGTGANARTFHNITVHHNAVSGTNSNDLCKMWGAQNDYWVQCGFGYADRDIVWFDQGYGGVTFTRCEWTGSVGRYWHRYDNQIAGGVAPWPFNIVFLGTNNLEGGSATSVSHVKMIAGVDITYDKSWFYSANALTGPSIDVGTGCILNLVNPSFQSKPSGTPTAGTKAISVAGTGRVTIIGRAQYLNFDRPINIDGLAAHIFDNTPPEFYNCTAGQTFTGTSSASIAQWENDSNGLRTSSANAADLVDITYTPTRSGILSERLGDGTIAYFPGTGFAGATAKWGPRNSGAAVGVPLAATTPVGIGGGTTATRPAASPALAGCLYINTDTNTIQWCNGTTWIDPPGSGSSSPRDLPSYAPTNAAHVWLPGDSSYNANAGSLHSWRAAHADYVDGNADLQFAAAGDSLIGSWNGSVYKFENCLPRNLAKQLAKNAGASFCNGIQMACADTANRIYDNVTNSGWTVESTTTLPCLKSTASGQSFSFTTLDPSTVIDLFVWDAGTSGMTWQIDGVSQTVVSTTGTNAVKKATSNTTLANTVHTVTVTSTAANQRVIAWWWRNPSIVQLYAHVLSLGGASANTATNPSIASNWSDTTVGTAPSPSGLGFVMQSLLSAAGVTPHATLISLGANDASAGTTAATIDTGLANVIGYSWLGATKVYLHPYKAVAAVTDALWDAFSTLVFTRCDTANIAMFDLDHYVNRRAGAVADSLLGADAVHPLMKLQKMAARMCAKLLSTGLHAPPLVQVRVESGGTYTPRFSTGVTPAGYSLAQGADQPADWVDGDPWDDLP